MTETTRKKLYKNQRTTTRNTPNGAVFSAEYVSHDTLSVSLEIVERQLKTLPLICAESIFYVGA